MTNDRKTSIEDRLLNFDEDGALGRTDCVDIFSYWSLGKRIVKALPRFAYSAPREIKIQDAPAEAVAEFKKVSKRMKQDMICRRTSDYARCFGMGGIAYSQEGQKIEDNLTEDIVRSGDGLFIAYDPLTLAGTTICQDYASHRFLRPDRIMIGGRVAGSRRATVIQNGDPVYLKFNESTFTFGGVSVYQNMIPLIKGWTRAIISLRRMATKASSVVFKGKEPGRASGATEYAASAAALALAAMENDGACTIDKNSAVEFFNMTGVAEVDAILKALEKEILFAVDDTPSAILLDKDLSNGMSEGSEDMRAVVMAVEAFREQFMTPLYDFTDPYVMAKAWPDEFIRRVIEGTDKAGTSPEIIRAQWTASFEYEFGNLYPEPESVLETKNNVIMQNLKLALDMGGDRTDIQNEMEARKIFKTDIQLIEPTPLAPAMPELPAPGKY